MNPPRAWALTLLVGLMFWVAVITVACGVLSGCAVTAPLEPIQRPPSQYRGNATVILKTQNPMTTGVRCAERGGSPVAMTCGGDNVVTIANPCDVLAGGWYAETLCHEIAHAVGWEPDHKTPPSYPAAP